MNAIIVLHEIYGRNRFIQMQSQKYQRLGFAVYSPDFNEKMVFDYSDEAAAYAHFYAHAGMNAYQLVWNLLDTLKSRHEKIFLLGYSAGATLAWRCSEHPNCAGVIACYGSRIRDYPDVTPCCPSLLLFAQRDRFDVSHVSESLKATPRTRICTFPAEHGFLDPYSAHYSASCAREAEAMILRFLDC